MTSVLFTHATVVTMDPAQPLFIGATEEGPVYAQRYEQLIELGYAASDPLVRPLELAIGTPARILYQGAAYDSVLTGYEDSGGIRTLSFGAVRLELTKKLILERRSR